jgi:hypothetical protein
MREIRPSGPEGGGNEINRSPYPFTRRCRYFFVSSASRCSRPGRPPINGETVDE